MQRQIRIDEVKRVASSAARVMITPKVVVGASSAADLKKAKDAARKVIAEHYDVLLALKDR